MSEPMSDEERWIVDTLVDIAPTLMNLGHAHARLDANARVLIARTIAPHFRSQLTEMTAELTRLRAIEVAAREFRAWMKRANVGIIATDDLFAAMDNLDDPSFAQQVVRTQMNRSADPGVEYGSGGSVDPAPDAVRPTGQTEGT